MATILIVDDLSSHRNFLVTLLAGHGHVLLEATNGREALASIQTTRPDLVITDVLMPVMGGYELVRRLRLDPGTDRIPVLFYTAPYGEREARAFARSSGLPYVLTKPGQPDEVLEIVGRVLAGQAEAEDADLGSAAVDVDHLQLLTNQLSEKSDDLNDANARLRALINIGLDLASAHGSDRLLQNVCDAACDLFGATYVTLGIVDRDDRTVRRVAACGTEASDWVKSGDLVSGILETVVTERRTLRGDNPGGDPAALKLPAGHPDVHLFLAAPIASRAHVYGWMCLVGNEGRTFTDYDEPMMIALASQVGRIYELEYEIIERKRAESAVRHERDRAQRYLDTAQVILLALDLDGRITLINRNGCDVLGWSESDLLGRNWIATCVPASIREEVTRTFHNVVGGDPAIVENLVLTRSGEERLVEWRNTMLRDGAGVIIGALSSGADITERRALEAQFQQAQKMEAVGRLAGGVAHDFNNLLTTVLGYCEMLLADLPPGHSHRRDLLQIQKAGVRGAGLTRQLLAFSRKQIIEPTVLSLNAIVTDMRTMLGRLIGEDITVIMNLAYGLAAVKADRGQVEQVIMNLAVNARDAMPTGGLLKIETANVELDDGYAATHASVKPGPYVALTISDTGRGMTAEVQARLFEPFFTTKEIGKGTGLGLATVHGMVMRSGGSVAVSSEVGKGASFKVYFPKADAAQAVAGAPRQESLPLLGTETVLLVEDSDELRELMSRLLEGQGYTVLAAANADEARRLFDEHASVDVILTDVVMPGTSGPDLIRQLVERQPGLKAIYMSGYTDDAIVQHGVLKPGIAFLHKPFTSETLGRKIREVIDRAVTGRVLTH